MKLLSFQPYSLYTSGGGSRILRRLFEGHESQISSLAVVIRKVDDNKGEIPETVVYTFPILRKWMRSYLRLVVTWLAEYLFLPVTRFKLVRKVKTIPHDIIHIISHGPILSTYCNDRICPGKIVWVSFHDHFSSTKCTFKVTNDLWNRADRRLVISPEIGLEYSRLFGIKKYEIITDGILKSEISFPLVSPQSPKIIYFAGLLHIDYYPLFLSLADALDSLSNKEISFKFILRGTQELDFFRNRTFSVEYRPFSLNEIELKEELDMATILYLPLMFSNANFYLYSLSTKLIGYLGGSGTIFYHGPNESAAYKLLQHTNSAICCTSIKVIDIVESLKRILNGPNEVADNAKIIARHQFNLEEIRKRFWLEDQ